MKISKLLSAALIAGASVSAQAGVLLSEDFTNVGALTGSGWAQVSNSVGPGSGWYQGVSAIMPGTAGATDDSYAAANFVGASTISDWLMTPVLTVTSSATLEFQLRLLGDSVFQLLDTVEVYVSNSGASTSTGDFSMIASFSSRSDTGWQAQSLALGPFNGRIGFRYYVQDTLLDGNFVGIDSVSVIPEPTSVALVALALAGVAATRRRA